MKTGIIGFGKMGSAIFKLFSEHADSIRVVTETENQADEARTGFFKKLEKAVNRGVYPQEVLEEKKERIRFSHCLNTVSDCDMIIEATFESLDVKSQLLHQLEPLVSTEAILLTNTSSLSINSMSNHLNHPHRFCGYHFFYPISLIDIVEIIVSKHTDLELVTRLKQIAASISKNAIVVQDAPGSVINAILAYYYAEALYILEEGLLPPSQIDTIARQFCYVGPCESLDVIGIDFFLSALMNIIHQGTVYPICWNSTTKKADKADFPYPLLFDPLISANRLGRKTNNGIYLYEKGIPVDDAMMFYSRNKTMTSFSALTTTEDIVSQRLFYGIIAFKIKNRPQSANRTSMNQQ